MKCATFSDNLIISFSDVWKTLKSAKYKIAVFSLFCALFFGHKALHQSVSYTAKSTFRGQAQISGSKLLETLSGASGRSNFTPSEPKTLLNSRSCVEFAVKKLHLQGCLSEKKKGPSSFYGVWQIIKTEYLINKYKKKVRPSSQILSGNVIVPDELLFEDEKPDIECKNIFYPDELFTPLDIEVSENDTFKVFHKKKLIGEGLLEVPFYWIKGCFTLHKTGFSRKANYQLTLIPLSAAAKGIIDNLKITRGKDNSSIIKLKYIHGNRKLAANILNALMLALEEYIRAENHKRSVKQLEYLEVHHNNTTEKLEKMMEIHAKNLQANLSSGELVTLQKEIEFITQSQGEYRQQLLKTSLDIQQIYAALNPQSSLKPAVEEIIEQIDKQNLGLTSEFDSLNLESAKEIQMTYYQELERIELEMKQYDYHIKELNGSKNEITSLTKTLNDKISLDLIAKAHLIQLQLLDEKNRSLKEQERLKVELNLQRGFLCQHLEQLKKIIQLEYEMIHDKLKQINVSLLKLNVKKYNLLQQQLKVIAEKTAKLPEKWLAEQKIELNKAIRMKVVETISNLIENRSIAHFLENIDSSPLDIAIFPLIPNPPGIFKKMIKGGVLGCGGIIFLIIVYAILKGPSVSYSNILGLGLNATGRIFLKKGAEWDQLSEKEHLLLKKLTHKISLKEESRIVLFQDKLEHPLSFNIAKILKYSEKRCVIVQISSSNASSNASSNESTALSFISSLEFLPLIKNADYDVLIIPIESQFKEAALGSESFKNIIKKLKDLNRWILIQNFASPKSLETEILFSYSNQFVVTATSNEKLDDYRLFLGKKESEFYNPKGFFITEENNSLNEWKEAVTFIKEKREYLYLHLRQLEPHLEALIKKISNYSVSKKVLRACLKPWEHDQ